MIGDRRDGMTLLEVLVAMSLLAVGMSGIMALFSTALSLQKIAVERHDVGLTLPTVLAEIERDLSKQVGNNPQRGSVTGLSGEEFPVPGNPQYKYRVTVEELPASSRGYLCRVVIVAKDRGQAREYDFGFIPIVPEPSNDARIRALLQQK